ncbi:MAG: hypothetical protein M3370_01440 [Actinomycetota bacterium]|nr:hypothetical protein [Actinomycetota bacterium]
MRAVRAGHTYVKVFGAGGPDLRLQAQVPGSTGSAAIMGDTIRAQRAEFTARVIGGGPRLDLSSPEAYQLLVVKDGIPVRVVPVSSDDFSLSFVGREPGR